MSPETAHSHPELFSVEGTMDSIHARSPSLHATTNLQSMSKILLNQHASLPFPNIYTSPESQQDAVPRQACMLATAGMPLGAKTRCQHPSAAL